VHDRSVAAEVLEHDLKRLLQVASRLVDRRVGDAERSLQKFRLSEYLVGRCQDLFLRSACTDHCARESVGQ
jgi:hypothetical protein